MPRVARIVVPGAAHHVVQRGNNKQDVFFVDDDRRVYLELLREQGRRFGFRVDGYCLMTNHVHVGNSGTDYYLPDFPPGLAYDGRMDRVARIVVPENPSLSLNFPGQTGAGGCGTVRDFIGLYVRSANGAKYTSLG